MKKYYFFFSVLLFSSAAFSQNVGIGTSTPQYKLDIAGSLMLRKGAQTAGVFFDGSNTTFRSFIGMYTDNLFGFYGSGSGWNILVNTQTGALGIGTLAPTAGLDINGDIRLRSGSPAYAAVLTSNDASGNAIWKKPVAFRVSGGPSEFALPLNQWVKLELNTIADYNVGLAWAPINQVFTAPAKGIFHFDFACEMILSKSITWRMLRRRNGVDTEVYYANESYSVNGTMLDDYIHPEVCMDLQLEASDQVWVEMRANIQGQTCYPSKNNMFFSGRMVSLL